MATTTWYTKAKIDQLLADIVAGVSADASTSAKGVVQLASTLEATTGTAANRVITPAALKSVTDALTTANNATFVALSATPPDHTQVAAYVDISVSPPALKGWNGSAWVALGGTVTAAVTTVDNGDGTFTATGAVTDNGDGTFSITDSTVTANADGTFTLAA